MTIARGIVHLAEAVKVATKRVATIQTEKKLATSFRSGFRLQKRAFLHGLARLPADRWPQTLIQEAITEEDWDPVWNSAANQTIDVFVKPLQAAVESALAAGIRHQLGAGEVQITFDLSFPEAREFLTNYGAQQVAGINATTRAYLRTVLTRAVDQGWSYNETARAISSRFEQFAVGVPQRHIRSRAELIAVTETGQAYEHGTELVGYQLQAAGIPQEKYWLHVKAKNVCPVCLRNAAVNWIPFAKQFPSGHMRPLGHPACRCTMLVRRVGAGGKGDVPLGVLAALGRL